MKFDEAMTFDEYGKQKLNSELANAIAVSSENILHPDNIKTYVEILGELIAKFACKHGYKPSPKANIVIKIPGAGATADPTDRHGTVSGKVNCKLTATKDQYVFYASEIIEELKGECRWQIEKTWKDRLIEHLTSQFSEKNPWLEDYEIEIEEEFCKKRDKLIEEIEKLVEGFEIP